MIWEILRLSRLCKRHWNLVMRCQESVLWRESQGWGRITFCLCRWRSENLVTQRSCESPVPLRRSQGKKWDHPGKVCEGASGLMEWILRTCTGDPEFLRVLCQWRHCSLRPQRTGNTEWMQAVGSPQFHRQETGRYSDASVNTSHLAGTRKHDSEVPLWSQRCPLRTRVDLFVALETKRRFDFRTAQEWSFLFVFFVFDPLSLACQCL